jgi:TonB-dependent starch-binding outer membrane protein SusC
MSKHYSLSLYLIITILVIPKAQIVLTGTVTDADCKPLNGVHISADGVFSFNEVFTDSNGYYQLELPNDSARLITFKYYQRIVKQKKLKQKVLNFSFDLSLAQLVLEYGNGCVVIKATPGKLGASTLLESAAFNEGAVDNPLQLIQGKVSGIDIQRIGGNPNAAFRMRLRGLTSLEGAHKPLIIIDNVPNAPLETVHPDDIASMEVLKDGSLSEYGSQAAAGAILIKTKLGAKASYGRPFKIDYKQNVSFENISNRFKTFNANEYVAAGGQNFNGNTDWMNVITRTGMAQRHHLSTSSQDDKSNSYTSVHYRNVSGILTNSDFLEYGFRTCGDRTMLKGKLTISVAYAMNTYKRNHGFEDAFRYATLFNPTVPTRLPDGTYKEFSHFDYFNPLAIVEQNWHRTSEKFLTTQFNIHYKLNNYFKINILGSTQERDMTGGQYYARGGTYRNFFGNGYAIKQTATWGQAFMNDNVEYKYSWDKHSVLNLTGWRYQIATSEIKADGVSDFPQDISTIDQFSAGRGNHLETSQSTNYKSSTIYNNFKYDYNNQFTIAFNLNQETVDNFKPSHNLSLWSSRLSANWLIIKNNLFINEARLRIGLGAVKNPIPSSRFTPIAPETKTELSGGIDFQAFSKRLTGSIDYFQHETQCLATGVLVGSNENPNSIQSKGIELDLNYKVLENSTLKWITNLQVSAVRSQLGSLGTFDIADGNIGAPGFGDAGRLVHTERGKPMGEIRVFQYDRIENGFAIGRDLNGNGVLDASDLVTAGQGLPNFLLNWSNQLNYKQLGLTVTGRGAFGHSLINAYRAHYERFGNPFTPYYNTVITDKVDKQLQGRTFLTSDLVENASFFTLEHITFSYTMSHFPCHYVWRPRYIKFLLSAHHLLTFTNYAGVTPEVRYTNAGATVNGDFQTIDNESFTPGIEQRNIYFPARTFSLGMQIGF